jgi:hypothetical protein
MNINLKNLLNVYGENAHISNIPDSNIKYGSNNGIAIYNGTNLIKKVYRGNTKLFDSVLDAQAQVIVSCENNKVLKINNLYVTNIDGLNSATITAYIDDGSDILSYIAKYTPVSAGQTVDLVIGQTSSIYLTEGQSIKLISNVSNRLSGFASYEKIS